MEKEAENVALNAGVALKRRLVRFLVLRCLVGSIGIGCFVVGAICIFARLFVVKNLQSYAVVAFVASMLIALGAAVWHTIRQVPSVEKLMAWLDGAYSGGGLVIASAHEDIGNDWREKLQVVGMPKIKISFRRELLLLACGILFAVIPFYMPAGMATEINAGTKLDIQDETEVIEEQLEFLEKNAEDFPEDKLQEMKDMLADIMQNSMAQDASKTYDMLDVLEERIQDKITEYRNDTIDKAVSMDVLADLIEKLESFESAEGASTAMDEIGKFLAELAAQDTEIAKLLEELSKIDENLDAGKLASGIGKTLTEEQRKKLAEALKANAERIKDKLRKMAENRGKVCQNCGNACNGSGECPFDEKSLEEWLESNCSSLSVAMKEGNCGNGTELPGGNGGVSRGRGDAPLKLDGNSHEFDAQFKDIGVNGMAKPDDTVAIKRTLSAPVVPDEAPDNVASGKLQVNEGNIKNARHPVHPHHRRAVREFFQ